MAEWQYLHHSECPLALLAFEHTTNQVKLHHHKGQEKNHTEMQQGQRKLWLNLYLGLFYTSVIYDKCVCCVSG